MMTGFSLDATSANHFLSSLSKSLQALCHGCMEFNVGVEINGYIHIDVDRDKTFDYVLNEKLQRKTNESMAFVSNSFFAKKDEHKKVKDVPFSSVSDMQEVTSLSTPFRDSPSHTHISHNSLKRANSNKDKIQNQAFLKRLSLSQHSNGDRKSLCSSDSYNSTHLHQGTSNAEKNSDSEIIHIKQEIMDYSNSDLLRSCEGDCKTDVFKTSLSKSRKLGKFISENDNVASHDKVKNQNRLLNPQSANFQEFARSTTVQNESGNCLSFNILNNQNITSSESLGVPLSQSLEFIPVGHNETSHCEKKYSHLSNTEKSEEAELSTSHSILEINKEVETTPLNESHLLQSLTGCQETFQHTPFSQSVSDNKWRLKELDSTHFDRLSFPLGQRSENLPYTCLACGKKYMHQYSLDRHMLTHQGSGRHYSCPICDKQFTQKPAMKRHMKTIHFSAQCPNCDEILATGDVFNQHILHCQSTFL